MLKGYLSEPLSRLSMHADAHPKRVTSQGWQDNGQVDLWLGGEERGGCWGGQRNTLRCRLECFCPYRGPPTPQKLESFFFLGIFLQL